MKYIFVTSGLCRMADNPEIWKAAAMADHFEKIQKLPDPVPGCPNFRRVPGYKEQYRNIDFIQLIKQQTRKRQK